MTQSFSFRSLIAGSTLAAIAGLAMFAQTGTASAKSVLSCEGDSRRSVVECCERIVQRKGMPFWMKQTGANCAKSSVKCFSVSSGTTYLPDKRVCKVVIQNEGPTETRRHDRQPNRNRDSGRDRPTSSSIN
jgi:hypothetical protein